MLQKVVNPKVKKSKCHNIFLYLCRYQRVKLALYSSHTYSNRNHPMGDDPCALSC